MLKEKKIKRVYNTTVIKKTDRSDKSLTRNESANEIANKPLTPINVLIIRGKYDDSRHNLYREEEDSRERERRTKRLNMHLNLRTRTRPRLPFSSQK